MATLAEALLTLLNADVTLSALLTGGVLNASDFSFDGGGMDEAPKQDNGVLIKPFAIVRFKSADQYGPILVRGRLQSVEIYVYDNVAYVTIDAAIKRIDTLLDQVRITADDYQLAQFQYAHESGELSAEEFGGVACRFIRFMNLFVR